MNTNENHIEHKLIHAFCLGKLSLTERQAFEKRLANDAALAESVALHRAIIAGIKADGEQQLKEKFNELDKIIPSPNSVQYTIRRFWPIAATVLILLGIALFFVFNTSKQEQALITNKNTKDSIVSKQQPEMPQVKENQIAQKINDSLKRKLPNQSERLFADNLYSNYFKPAPNLIPKSRSDVPEIQDSLSKAMEFYDNKKYGNALVILSQLSTNTGNESFEDALFYAGICCMAQKQYENAESYFKLLQSADVAIYKEKTAWYLSLIFIKTDRIPKAKELLLQLSKSNGALSDNAKSVLSEIENRTK